MGLREVSVVTNESVQGGSSFPREVSASLDCDVETGGILRRASLRRIQRRISDETPNPIIESFNVEKAETKSGKRKGKVDANPVYDELSHITVDQSKTNLRLRSGERRP